MGEVLRNEINDSQVIHEINIVDVKTKNESEKKEKKIELKEKLSLDVFVSKLTDCLSSSHEQKSMRFEDILIDDCNRKPFAKVDFEIKRKKDERGEWGGRSRASSSSPSSPSSMSSSSSSKASAFPMSSKLPAPPPRLPRFPFLRVPLFDRKWIDAPFLDFRQRVRATCEAAEPLVGGSVVEDRIRHVGWLRKASRFEKHLRADHKSRLDGCELSRLRLRFIYSMLTQAKSYGLVDDQRFPL